MESNAVCCYIILVFLSFRAPQVYFEDDTAKNLESEILRASKIKCTKCRRKGAALGCYSKSCRKSFHPRCAVDVPGCKWDDVRSLFISYVLVDILFIYLFNYLLSFTD